MRGSVIAAALLLAACGQGAPAATDVVPEAASAGAASAVEEMPAVSQTVKLDAAGLVGGWSFDKTCASEDAMGLMPDGKAYFDEWGEGVWAVDDQGRLVLTLRELTPGAEDDGGGEQLVMTLTPTAVGADTLAGELSSPREDIPARTIDAVKCPET